MISADVRAARCQVLIGSPEVLCRSEWHNLFKSQIFQNQVVAVCYDECHCISQWFVTSVLLISIICLKDIEYNLFILFFQGC